MQTAATCKHPPSVDQRFFFWNDGPPLLFIYFLLLLRTHCNKSTAIIECFSVHGGKTKVKIYIEEEDPKIEIVKRSLEPTVGLSRRETTQNFYRRREREARTGEEDGQSFLAVMCNLGLGNTNKR